MTNNNINISSKTIDNYANNKQVLKDLSLRMKSGSCSLYDIVLYNVLVRNSENNKKLTLQVK